MNHLELFSGTHSFGKVFSKKGYIVYSLDRDLGGTCPFTDYKSKNHIKEDIMTWDYKKYDKGFFKLITASPVCLWWSTLRNTWIGRKLKGMTRNLTREDIQNDINKYGKPMLDKVIEIIEYFNPKYYIIENPQTGKMKHYIKENYPNYDIFYDFDYCKYSDFGYKKRTRFWTNIKGIKPLLCKNDCDNLINGKLHKISMGSWGKKGTSQTGIGGGNNRLGRYRIPEKLIEQFLINI
tara:strand:- start:2219 stop:2926 length:708 start_codon:yes stop_codon:yes gene_type:complete